MAKRALCIGINDYPGTGMDLKGCVNDARDWSAELASRGFEVRRLLDAQATKAAMVAGFRELIAATGRGDIAVISFSGHGTVVPEKSGDGSGDERDGYDEGLCPHDVQTAGAALIDDEIAVLFRQRRPGARLVLIADSCHSGTVTRQIGQGPGDDDLPRPRFLPPANWMAPEQLTRGGVPHPPARPRASAFGVAVSRRSEDLLLAGCQEGPEHYSFDARIAGRDRGAFSHFALKTLKDLPAGASYDDWHAAITPACLPTSSFPQTPQIFGNAASRKRAVFA